ncbi:MAG: helicase associated domain-containing protein, partial [Magnetococcales bacterium]|nr:helicase associated domain-containing protein [Magnetococcales bacterium]
MPRETEDKDWQKSLKEYGDLWNSLQLFKERDHKFADELTTIRINFGRTGNWEVEPLLQWLEILAKPEIETEEILINCVKGLTSLWEERFGQLLAFRDQHNHCNVPPRWPDNPELSTWAEQQRKNHSKALLPKIRYQELENSGFIWDPKKTAWEEKFQELKIYKSQKQNCKVPKGWEPNPELADWVIKQRREQLSGRLDPEWAERLTALGFVWDLEADNWETGFSALGKFRKIHGHAQVPRSYPHNPKLSEWAEQQRNNEKKGKLSLERIERLNSLGFIWDLEEADWEERFALFERFRDINGHGKIADKDRHMPKLSEWATAQRKERAQGKLDPIREQRLEEAGFVWDLEQSYWDEMFLALKEYQLKHNNCTLPEKGLERGSVEENISLWSQKQRLLRRQNRLHPNRINRLNAIGFAWDYKVAVWEKMFREFLFFKLCNGNGKLEDRYQKNPPLGLWAKSQRREWIMGSLDSERKARLEEAGFIWNLEEAAWEEQFANLKNYYQQEGHFNLPPNLKNYPDLPAWVKKQRSLYSKKTLAKKRVAHLEEIGFIWNVKEAAWEEMFTALTLFTKSRKHCIVPAKWPENPRLAQWIHNLRRDYKKGKLDPVHKERLTKLGFIWEAKAVFWEEMFAALTEYRDKNGDCLVPENYSANSELGWWVATQRKAKLSGQLDQARIKRLDALEFIWDIAQAEWLDMYR